MNFKIENLETNNYGDKITHVNGEKIKIAAGKDASQEVKNFVENLKEGDTLEVNEWTSAKGYKYYFVNELPTTTPPTSDDPAKIDKVLARLELMVNDNEYIKEQNHEQDKVLKICAEKIDKILKKNTIEDVTDE